jgi:hypothetical protein
MITSIDSDDEFCASCIIYVYHHYHYYNHDGDDKDDDDDDNHEDDNDDDGDDDIKTSLLNACILHYSLPLYLHSGKVAL